MKRVLYITPVLYIINVYSLLKTLNNAGGGGVRGVWYKIKNQHDPHTTRSIFIIEEYSYSIIIKIERVVWVVLIFLETHA